MVLSVRQTLGHAPASERLHVELPLAVSCDNRIASSVRIDPSSRHVVSFAGHSLVTNHGKIRLKEGDLLVYYAMLPDGSAQYLYLDKSVQNPIPSISHRHAIISPEVMTRVRRSGSSPTGISSKDAIPVYASFMMQKRDGIVKVQCDISPSERSTFAMQAQEVPGTVTRSISSISGQASVETTFLYCGTFALLKRA